MKRDELDTQKEILRRLKADIDKTLDAHRKIIELQGKKIEQDLEQVRVYLNILETGQDVKLNARVLKKLDKVLAWKLKDRNLAYCETQDKLESHFRDLQKALVGLISKKFKY